MEHKFNDEGVCTRCDTKVWHQASRMPCGEVALQPGPTLVGYVASVYRDAGGPDCSLNGPSATATNVWVVGDAIGDAGLAQSSRSLMIRNGWVVGSAGKLFGIPQMLPAFEVQVKMICGEPYRSLRPFGIGDLWSMFGGNYAASSDSRWCRLFGHSAVAIHDRMEDVSPEGRLRVVREWAATQGWKLQEQA